MDTALPVWLLLQWGQSTTNYYWPLHWPSCLSCRVTWSVEPSSAAAESHKPLTPPPGGSRWSSFSLCPYIFWMPDTNRSDGSVTTSKAKSINWARLSNPSGDCAFKHVHDCSDTLEEGKHTCSEIQLHQQHVTTRLSLQVWALVNTVSMEITAGEDSYAEILGG